MTAVPTVVSGTAATLRLPPLRPGGFTFVMATAIVSISVHNAGAVVLSEILFWMGLGSFVVLSVDYLARMVISRSDLVQSPPAGFLSLTFTAASGVLASRLAILDVSWAALVLTLVGLISWLALSYAVVISQLLRTGDTPNLGIVDGTWFLWVVGTLSVAVAAGSYAVAFTSPPFAAISAVAWSIGLLQFLLIASVTFARLLLTRLPANADSAPYWVFTGSAAIIALGGAGLLELGSAQDLLAIETVATISTILWAFSTWLFPLIVALTIWQRIRPGGLTGFRPAMWSMAFPIGMYGEASRQLGDVRSIFWLEQLGVYEAWLALAIWLFVFATMIGHYLLRKIAYYRPKQG